MVGFRNNAILFQNVLKLTLKNPESNLLKQFFKISNVSENSIVLNSDIASGNIKNSVLINVTVNNANLSDCVLINCSVKDINAEKSLLYKVSEKEKLSFPSESVRADAPIPFYTSLKRDGKEDWEIILPGNIKSYAERQNQRF